MSVKVFGELLKNNDKKTAIGDVCLRDRRREIGMTARSAIVTGAGSGIGRGIAERLAADGFRVICADICEESAKETAGKIGGGAVSVRADAGEESEAVHCVRKAGEICGRLDALVNCAGVHLQALVAETEASDWDRIHRVNARGTFLMCREAARAMLPNRAGRIVNIITKLGFGNPYSAVYMASKCAAWGLTQCLAAELARAGITVNAVAPGHAGPGTGMERAFREKARKLGLEWHAFESRLLDTVPAGRWCRPADVAAAVSFLLRDEAAFITGEVVHATGGLSGFSFAPPEMPE